MSIDWDKPVKIEDGRAARIYTTEGADPNWPVVGEYFDSDGYWYASRWAADGRAQSDSRHLVNVAQQHTVCVNVYKKLDYETSGFRFSPGHNSKTQADSNSTGDRIACIEVMFTEGEGLGTQ